jgi:hypothetical protein
MCKYNIEPPEEGHSMAMIHSVEGASDKACTDLFSSVDSGFRLRILCHPELSWDRNTKSLLI